MNTRGSYKAREIQDAVENWVSARDITQNDIQVVERSIRKAQEKIQSAKGSAAP
jgi:hypothetical protein